MIKLLIAAGIAVLGLLLILVQVFLDVNMLQPVGVFGTFFVGIGFGLLIGMCP